MMKILKNRKMSIEDEDKFTIRLLRQEYYLNDQQLTYKLMTRDEYNESMRKLLAKIIMLENKYGIGEDVKED